LKQETDFLSAVGANFEAAKGKDFRGSIWRLAEHDETDRLRALLASNRISDRDRMLKTLPANRRIALHGFDRRMLFWRRKTGVAIASVLSPLEHYAAAAGGDPPPVGLGELTDHLRKLTGDRSVRYIVGVCSPSGFTDEARQARLEASNAAVVLIEPDGQGGWRTTAAGDSVDPRLLKIFDPEGGKQKVERVRRIVQERSADLLTGGLSVSSVARAAHLPEQVVRDGFEKIAAADGELRTATKDGEFLLFRGAPAKSQENRSMSVIERLKQLLSGAADEAAKINLLAERRAALSQRRDRIYDDIIKLEKKEADLFDEGKAATSPVPKRRLAAQLAQLRKDIARQNTSAAMLNQQINIISTDIHNLTLIQQGQIAKLPDTAELTEHAVAAEEMLETLKADADLVGSLEMGLDATVASAEELAILKEFEVAAEKPKMAESVPPARAKSAAPKEADSSRASERSMDEPGPKPREASRRPADPEPT
jgi:hypothetical protein